MKDLRTDTGRQSARAFVALTVAGQTALLRRFRELDMVPAICVGGVLVFLIAGLFGGFDISAKSTTPAGQLVSIE
jgi:hypothetical protein